MSESPKERYARLKVTLLLGGFSPAVDHTLAEEGVGPVGDIRRAHEEAVLFVKDFEAILSVVRCNELERQVMITRWIHYREIDSEVMERVAEGLGVSREDYERIYKRVLQRIRRAWLADTRYQLGESSN